MLLDILLLALGIFLVVKGADFLVDGGASIAKKFGISQIVIGLTVVAFGTSMPELVVNLFSAFRGITGVSVGNIIGSNISNLLLVMGAAAIIFPLKFSKETKNKELPYSIFGAILLMFLFNDFIFGKENILSRLDGFILLFFFIMFFVYLWKTRKNRTDEGEGYPELGSAKSIIFVLLGSIMLYFGGKFTIDSVTAILSSFNISEMLISSTVIAIGTSLPELAASVTAAFKKNPDIAVGNVIGSNIFNILWVLGLTSIVIDIPFRISWNLDILFLIGASLLLFCYMFIGKKNTLERWNGVSFIVLYLIYIAFLIIRG